MLLYIQVSSFLVFGESSQIDQSQLVIKVNSWINCEEYYKNNDVYDGSIVNKYADVFLPPTDYSFSFHFYFILTPALKRTFGQRPPLKKLICIV